MTKQNPGQKAKAIHKISLDMDQDLYDSFITTIQEREGLPIDPTAPLPRGLRSKILNQAIAQWIARGTDDPVIGKTRTDQCLIILRNELRRLPHQLELEEIKQLVKEKGGVYDPRSVNKYIRLMGKEGYIQHIGYDQYAVKTLFANMVLFEEDQDD